MFRSSAFNVSFFCRLFSVSFSLFVSLCATPNDLGVYHRLRLRHCHCIAFDFLVIVNVVVVDGGGGGGGGVVVAPHCRCHTTILNMKMGLVNCHGVDFRVEKFSTTN